MNQSRSDERSVSDGVHLLISILIRYPEIGTVTFDPDQHTLKLAFMLYDQKEEIDFAGIENFLAQSLHTYHKLERFRQPYVSLFFKATPPLLTLTLIRDIYSFGKGEIDLVIAFLKERLGEALIVEENHSLLEEELRFQEELIDNMLQNVQKEDFGRSLFGIREEGRVMVFNK